MLDVRSVIKRPTDSTTSAESGYTNAKSRQTSTTNGHTNGCTSITSGQTSTKRGQIITGPVLN